MSSTTVEKETSSSESNPPRKPKFLDDDVCASCPVPFHKDQSVGSQLSTVASAGSNLSGKDNVINRLSLRERRNFGQALPDLDTNQKSDKYKSRRTKKRIIDVSKEGIAAHYVIGETLALRPCGDRVSKATKVSDGQPYIVKQREKARRRMLEADWRSVMGTILNTTKREGHCLPIEEILEDEDSFYIISDHMKGGELFEYLLTATEITEREAQRILREILLGLKQLHDMGMIHRDVKPENIMFEDHGAKLKLIDFDLCQPWSPKTPSSGRVVGTPGYIAPECLMGEFSPQSDIWSVGVIFYVLMVGDLPYSMEFTNAMDCEAGSPTSHAAYRKICETEIDWEAEPWPEFSEARDLCQRLLDVKTEKRIQSVDAALRHPFFDGFQGDA